ncbi:MAG TPA: CAP domain-containing protein [bacterium]|nr:CAP domain-containing protein [bacterium]
MAWILIIALSFWGFTPGPTPQEQHLIDLINHARVARHLPTLIFSQTLAECARLHSRDMKLHRFFGHGSSRGESFERRITLFVRPTAVTGENVAIAGDVDAAERALLASPDHRANILDPRFKYVGVGIETEAGIGVVVTEDFSG